MWVLIKLLIIGFAVFPAAVLTAFLVSHYRKRMGPRLIVRTLALGVIAMAPGCDSADSTITATTTGTSQRATSACYPRTPISPTWKAASLSTEDGARVHVGDCIGVTKLNQLEPELRDDPLRSIHVLDKTCKRP